MATRRLPPVGEDDPHAAGPLVEQVGAGKHQGGPAIVVDHRAAGVQAAPPDRMDNADHRPRPPRRAASFDALGARTGNGRRDDGGDADRRGQVPDILRHKPPIIKRRSICRLAGNHLARALMAWNIEFGLGPYLFCFLLRQREPYR